MTVFPDNRTEIRDKGMKVKKQILNEAAPPRIICPKCHGNGYIKLPHTADTDKYILQQCKQCSSQGEIDGKV